MSVRSASAAALHGAGSIVDRLLERPREVLGALILGQIVGTIVLGLSVAHNGWVWFQGGDQIWMTTTGWLFGRLELPPTEIAYLWPLVQAPMTWVTGSTFVQLLPILVVLQVLLLGPVALLCFYGIASRIGGRLLGYWAALLWVVTPYLSIPLWVDRYQERWAEHFLPQALGLTAMADFPSMVLALAAAYFVVRSLEPERMRDAVFAGALLGAAGALKPANMLLAAGVALAYLVARRWREGAACAAAAAPALLVLLAWKVKGLGDIPALALGQAHIAAASGPLALDLSISRYFDFDLDHWRQQMDQLREFFWSARLAQWAPFAGLLAVLRVRRGAIAALLAGWLAAFIVIKGFSPRASIEANTFWRLLLPAWPAYLLLFASIPLLIPTLPRRLGERVRPAVGAAPVAWRWIAVAAALTVALPAVAIAASKPLGPPTPEVVQDFPGSNILTPVDEAIRVDVAQEGSGHRITWVDDTGWRADVFYRVYRYDGTGDDLECLLSGGAAWYCTVRGTPIGTTRETTFLDTSAPEDATYRIGIGTNWIDDPEAGDVFAFSPPVVSSG